MEMEMENCRDSHRRQHVEQNRRQRPAKRTNLIERAAKDDQNLLYKISILLDSKSLKHCRSEDGRIIRVDSIEPIFTEEEKETLLEEGAPIPSALPLTKSEEHTFKKVRRKIKNKISAQESRRKKKEYMDGLERRTDQTYTENRMLRQRLESQENTIRTLILELNNMQSALKKEREMRKSRENHSSPIMKDKCTQTGICLKCLQAKKELEHTDKESRKIVENMTSHHKPRNATPTSKNSSSQTQQISIKSEPQNEDEETEVVMENYDLYPKPSQNDDYEQLRYTTKDMSNASSINNTSREASSPISAFSVPHGKQLGKSVNDSINFTAAIQMKNNYSPAQNNILQELFYDQYSMISSY